MKKLTLTAVSLVLATVGASAYAADTKPANTTAPAAVPAGHEMPKPGEHMFGEIDTNHDGSIGKDEWTAKGDKMFNDIDTNHDGKLSPDEMKAHHEAMREKFAKRRDELKAAPTGDVKKN